MLVSAVARKSLTTSLMLASIVGSTFASAAQSASVPQDETQPIIATLTPDPKGWGEIGFVNVPKFPFDGKPGSAIKKPPLGPTSKTIFQSPEAGPGSTLPVGQLIHLEYLPTFTSKMPPAAQVSHYHEFHEWGYTLAGDAIMPEPVNPDQVNGMYYRKKEGGWLSRPPYSLHGGTLGNGGLRNQLPYSLLIFEEGDGHVINVGRNGEPGNYRGRDGGPPPPGVVGDYRKVEEFTRPWLLDSTRDVDWEEDREVPGRFVKWLDDSRKAGFRSRLVKIPPGWKAPPGWGRTYFEHANVMRYMVWGDMKVWRFKGPKDEGSPYLVGKDYFIYQPPRTIWGYGPEAVTERGAIWLEVTYAKGLKHGGGPIEEVKRLD